VYRGRRDANHAAIRDGLREAGYLVQDLGDVGDGCADLLVAHKANRLRWRLLEVKDGSKPPSARRLTPAEEEFREQWGPHYTVVTSLAEALEALR
jgi:hypothetical protein